jgi:WD repeat-containing protein 23
MDGNYAISNGYDNCIKLWDLRKLTSGETHPRSPRNCFYRKPCEDQSVMTYTGHKVMQTLIRCRFSPESTGQKYIYTGSFEGSVYGK